MSNPRALGCRARRSGLSACFWTGACVAILSFVPGLASELDAQVVEGRTVDTGTGAGVPDARVLAVHTDRGDTLVTSTGRTGQFELRLPRSGTYTLTASRLGYETDRLEVAVASGQRIEVEFELVPEAILLDSVVVSGVGVPLRHLGTWQGFQARYQERRLVGPARLFAREDPEFRAGATVADIVRSITRGPTLRGPCDDPVTFVDGMRLPGWTGEVVLAMSAEEVRGVEFYRDLMAAPMEYRANDPGCGILAIWRRR